MRLQNALATRFARFTNQATRPTPIPQVSQTTVSVAYISDSINGQTLMLGVVPQPLPRCWVRAKRIWAIFDTAESGADGSNNTSLEFRVGDTGASYTVLGTLSTEGNPVAGSPLGKVVSFLPKPGQGLTVAVTRNGAAVDLDNAGVSLGVEFQHERFT